jgi:membrane protease YdiL (CAAX protease family)
MSPTLRTYFKMKEQFKAVQTWVWIYILIVYLFTFSIDYLIIHNGESVYDSTSLVSLRMWMPSIIGLILAWITQRNKIFNLLITIPRAKFICLSYFLPVLIGLISLGLLSVSEVTTVGARADLIQKYQGIGPLLWKALVYSPTVGLFIPLMACLGEELGWRGYLFSETENLSPNFRKFFNGLIWAIYHWPLILFSDYATSQNRVYSLILFTIMIISSAVIICWIQEQSKSLWTSVICHAAHNLWIIGILPGFYVTNDRTPYLIGEGGLFLTFAYVVAAWAVIWKSSFNPKP